MPFPCDSLNDEQEAIIETYCSSPLQRYGDPHREQRKVERKTSQLFVRTEGT